MAIKLTNVSAVLAKVFAGVLGVFLFVPLVMMVTGKVDFNSDWRAASHDSVGIAPKPSEHKDAIVQVYAAKAFGWRGAFAVHSWIAVKPKGAKQYTIYQVIGWNEYRKKPVLDIKQDMPDRQWYNAMPEILFDLRGKPATEVIALIEQAAKSYPYSTSYSAWPGPNSNTFVAYVLRQVPQFKQALPVTAVGKDYLPQHQFVTEAVSGTGKQFSFYGLLSITLAKQEGFEFNLLGLSMGISPKTKTIQWPGVGAIKY